jgi:hypothetical protein
MVALYEQATKVRSCGLPASQALLLATRTTVDENGVHRDCSICCPGYASCRGKRKSFVLASMAFACIVPIAGPEIALRQAD